jgi:hypothetical protein
MHEDRDISDSTADFAKGDYEYDLAHDATSGPSAADQAAAQEQRESPHIETRTDDDDGDYGYDLAHDMGG